MAWKFIFGDKSFMLDDLTPGEVMDVCKDFPAVNWLGLYRAPAADPDAFYALLRVVSAKLEVPCPPRAKTMREAVALLKHIDSVPDDLPTAITEGGSPLEVVKETTGSSTSRTSGDGRPSKFAHND